MRHLILPLICALLSTLPAGWTEEGAAVASTAGEAPAGERHEPAEHREAIAPSNAQALQRLMEGNARYVAGKATHPHQDAARRAEVATVQKPLAIIVTCADSRVGPEVVFDQGLGDIFVLRVAGNVADDDVQASIEYAVEHLGVNLVMVLGHERCGAVKAALAGGELPGHLAGLIERIRPAVESTRGQPGDALDNAVAANARLVAGQLRASRPLLQPRVAAGSLAVVAARLDLDTGAVELLW